MVRMRRAGGSSAARLDRCAALALGSVVLALPFAAFAVVSLHHFYIQGSFLLDAGWTAHLVSHGGLTLPYPLALGGHSYFNWHVGPILIVTGWLRQALPLSDLQYFAAFTGVCHALPALAVFWLLRSGYAMRRGLHALIAALLAVAFAGNGLAWAIARYPHSEILVAGAVMLFVVALVERRPAVAAICLAVALVTREDAGLHVFGLLFVLIVLNRWRAAPWRAQTLEITYATVALVYAIAALACQRAWSAMPSTLAVTYLGDPPFVHLSVATVLLRLQFVLSFRGYLVLPALVAAMWALRTRNPYILAGYAAFLPWVLLQLIAYSDIAGTLSGYYAYPLMIAAFWPLAGLRLNRRQHPTDGRKPAVLWFTLMIAASFVSVGQQYNPGRLDLPAAFLSPPSLERQQLTDRAVAAFAASRPALGAIAADTSVVALAPDLFSPAETVLWPRVSPPNTVVYLETGYDAATARRVAAETGLARHYRVPGAGLRLATDRPVPADLPIAALLVPAERSD